MSENFQTPRFRLFILFLAIVGISLSFVSLYDHVKLTYAHELGVVVEPSFCNINAAFNCDAVNESAWSKWFGIPLAAYGLVFYLSLFVYPLLLPRDRGEHWTSFRNICLALSVFAAGLSFFLFGVSKLAIGTLCIICMGLYVVSILFLGASVFAGWSDGMLFSRLARGMSELFKLPFVLFGWHLKQHPGRFRKVWSGLICIVVLSLGAYLLPTYIVLSKFQDGSGLQELARERAGRQLNEALRGWRVSDVFEFHLRTETDSDQDYYLGSPDAPVKIVEFADYECPACQAFSLVINELMQNFEGKIFYVFKNFPLSSACNPKMDQVFHPNSCYAANLARCAGDEGKFWPVSDALFALGFEEDAESSSETQTKAKMDGILEKFELNSDSVKACIKSEKHFDRLREDAKEGDLAGVDGTPSVWVNGKRVRPVSYEALEAIINEILGS